MTTQPVEKLIYKMSIPSIISVLVTAIYNMVDTIHVGKISTESTAAIGIVFSYMALMQAIGYFFWTWLCKLYFPCFRSKRYRWCRKDGSNRIFLCFNCWSGCSNCSIYFMDPLLRILGATNSIMPDTISSLKYILIGIPWIIASFVLNNQMRLQENAYMSMIGFSIRALLNIILDPIFKW